MKTIIQKHFEAGILTLAIIGAAAFFAFPYLSQAAMLTAEVSLGSTGADVTSLQTFLAQDPTLYPQGLVTGYYGPLTENAVANFQTRNGINAVGMVGPITLAAINAQMTSGLVRASTGASSVSTVSTGLAGQLSAAAISSVSVSTNSTSATVNWYTNMSAKGAVYVSTSPLSETENVNTVSISGNAFATDGSYRTAQSVLIQNLQPNTLYYYSVYSVNQAGNASVSWPSTFQTTH